MWEITFIVQDLLIHVLGTVLSLSMTIAIGGLMIYQFWNICKGLTSLESYIKVKKENNKSKYQNFKQFMGSNLFYWLEPFSRMSDLKYNYFRPTIVRNDDHKAKKLLQFYTGEFISKNSKIFKDAKKQNKESKKKK